MAEQSKIGKVTGTWGGILSGVAAMLTAVGLSVTDTSGDKAQKADDKSELVLDLIKDQFKFAEKERDRLSKELTYQREINAKLFRMVADLRVEMWEEPTPEPAPPAHRWRPSKAPKSTNDPLEEAIGNLSMDEQLDMPEPPEQEDESPLQAILPEDLEDMLPEK